MTENNHDPLLVRALREPTPDYLPRDFARGVATSAAEAASAPFENVLMTILIVAFGVASAVMIAHFGGRWMLDARENAWLLALGACFAVSWGVEKCVSALRPRGVPARP